MGEPTFRLKFCKHFDCPDSEYERRALKKCLYTHARCLAPVLCRVWPDFFERDLVFIRYLGQTTGTRDANGEVLGFQESNRFGGFLRRELRFRVSGHKATVLAGRLFGRDSD